MEPNREIRDGSAEIQPLRWVTTHGENIGLWQKRKERLLLAGGTAGVKTRGQENEKPVARRRVWAVILIRKQVMFTRATFKCAVRRRMTFNVSPFLEFSDPRWVSQVTFPCHKDGAQKATLLPRLSCFPPYGCWVLPPTTQQYFWGKVTLPMTLFRSSRGPAAALTD